MKTYIVMTHSGGCYVIRAMSERSAELICLRDCCNDNDDYVERVVLSGDEYGAVR